MSREKAKHYLVRCLEDIATPPEIHDPHIRVKFSDELREDIERIVNEIMDGVKQEIRDGE